MSWFTRMELLDHIYHQFFFTANSLWRQPTTSQYFLPLAPLTLALAVAAIHCALSEYTSGKKATVMLYRDGYLGTFGPSPVIDFTLGATTQSITHQQPLHTPTPPPPEQRNSTRIGAPQSSSELLRLDWTSCISFHSQFLLSQRSSIKFCTLYPPFRTPQPRMGALQFPQALLYCIPHSLSTLFWRSSAWITTLQSHQCFSAWFASPLFRSTLLNPPFFQHSTISFRTPSPPSFGTH